jgi:hypothetical protein
MKLCDQTSNVDKVVQYLENKRRPTNMDGTELLFFNSNNNNDNMNEPAVIIFSNCEKQKCFFIRRIHIRACVPLWCEDKDEFRSDRGITGFAVAPAYRVGVSKA